MNFDPNSWGLPLLLPRIDVLRVCVVPRSLIGVNKNLLQFKLTYERVRVSPVKDSYSLSENLSLLFGFLS
jgi:hypothetical protein